MSRGRYAPSPTGNLHLGNARTALVAWLRARSAGSSFVLRVEDLDEPRTMAEAVTGNLAELRWLGLDWDEGPDVGGPHEPYRQSGRHQLYREALERLEARGLTFECYLSRKELRELSSAPHGAAPVYGEHERRLNARLAERKRREGKGAAVRLRVAEEQVAFVDGLQGSQRFEAQRDVGDIVLRRADGAWAYNLAVVVDDAAMGVEEVVRGADLLPATAAQLLLYRALGLREPSFLHVPLLLDSTGERLAKRRGGETLAELRRSGAGAQRVVGALAFTLGLLAEPTPVPPGELVNGFDVERLKREPFALTPALVRWMAGGSRW